VLVAGNGAGMGRFGVVALRRVKKNEQRQALKNLIFRGRSLKGD